MFVNLLSAPKGSLVKNKQLGVLVTGNVAALKFSVNSLPFLHTELVF